MKKFTASAVVFFSLLGVPIPNGTAQGDRSLTDSELHPFPDRGRVPLRLPGARPDPGALQETILLLRASIQELSTSLAIANAEAETFKRQAEELALRLDSLGLAELDPDPASLEQKLLTAVRELRLEQQKRLELEETVVELLEALLTLMRDTPEIDPQARMEIETRIRRTNETLGSFPGLEEAPAVEPDLTNALVLEFNPDLSLLIANVGSRHGVRIGVPFRILRGSEIIGSALVVDVRERISGAIIQDLQDEERPVQSGDRLRVITR